MDTYYAMVFETDLGKTLCKRAVLRDPNWLLSRKKK